MKKGLREPREVKTGDILLLPFNTNRSVVIEQGETVLNLKRVDLI